MHSPCKRYINLGAGLLPSICTARQQIAVCTCCKFTTFIASPELPSPPITQHVIVVAQVVGCIVEHEGKILLCKRAIEPCKGKWTLPAGYMELKESSAGQSCPEFALAPSL